MHCVRIEIVFLVFFSICAIHIYFISFFMMIAFHLPLHIIIIPIAFLVHSVVCNKTIVNAFDF